MEGLLNKYNGWKAAFGMNSITDFYFSCQSLLWTTIVVHDDMIAHHYGARKFQK